ncbi:MAG: sugar transferase [Beijerinckiaceae bacterium]|nr:sugar transferase [Beijerinckiaceae bacterium]
MTETANSTAATSMARRKVWLKRIFDIGLSLIAIVILAPLIITVSFLLLLVQGSPLLESDRRTGRGGIAFSRFKFKTRDKDEGLSAFGYILRRTNIDELPQLLNVLRGDMSFVGPPPAIAIESDESEADNLRVAIRPGIACPWKAEAEKANVARIELIGVYVRTWTLRADIAVLLRAMAMPHGSGNATL